MDEINSDCSSEFKLLRLIEASKRRKRVQLPISCLAQAIDIILEPKQKPTARMTKIRENSIAKDQDHVIALCSNRTHLVIFNTLFSKRKNLGLSVHPLFQEMRLCLLASDWDGFKEILQLLLERPYIQNGYILFLIRSCFVLLLNHPNRTPELLDNFMAACLFINDESRRIQYLKDCFLLKRTSDYSISKIINDMNEEEEEEEEELFFNSEFNSDSDD